MTESETLSAATRSVVSVGGGRGFVVVSGNYRFVLTAAHCLPHFPPVDAGLCPQGSTYPALLGLLGDDPEVCAECRFADPIGDVAVLGPPDDQELSAEFDGYEALVENVPALPVREASEQAVPWQAEARLLSLDGRWNRCIVGQYRNGMLWIEDATDGIYAGMSGSPILATDGSAIGIVSNSRAAPNTMSTAGASPSFMGSLPNWLVRQLV